MNRTKRIGTRIAVAGLAGALSALVAVPPAHAHPNPPVRVGNAVGEVGPAHSGARLCELSPTWFGFANMDLRVGDGYTLGLTAADGCESVQLGHVGGIVRFRVGYDQGGGIIWSRWTTP
jgi:hypothetical protein